MVDKLKLIDEDRELRVAYAGLNELAVICELVTCMAIVLGIV